MNFPYIGRIPESRSITDVFSGYDRRLGCPEGSFRDTGNLTSDYFPMLSPRRVRGLFASPDSCTGIIAKEELCYTDGAYFVMGGTRIDMGLTDEPKQLISMGAYVIILPDKKYINTVDTSDRGDIERAFTSQGKVAMSICDVSGETPCLIVGQRYAPNISGDGDYWIDTSKEPYTMNVYSRSRGSWGEFSTAAVRIDAEGIDGVFEIGDSLQIDGFASSFECTDKVSVQGDALSSLTDKERCVTVMNEGEGYIIVTGPVSAVVQLLGKACEWFWDNIDDLTSGGGATAPTSLSQTEPLTFSRNMPIMDHVIECGNRLWGCRYGKARNGETVNEIYASKLGDFKNWNDFRGIDSDSWVATVGADGPFTGAVNYGGHPLFFKEAMLIRISGDVTSSFGYSDTPARGPAPGSGGSLAIVNEVLYYHSRHGICAYDGSLPVGVSDEFGEARYKNAVGGSFGDKYYVSLTDMSGGCHLFVYDTARRLWHREDSTHAVGFAAIGGELYYLDAGDGRIKSATGGGDPVETMVLWYCETGLIGTGDPDVKCISRFTVRLKADIGTVVRFFVEYDSSGDFIPAGTYMGTGLTTVNLPLILRRCDHARLRIEGEGDCKIFSITKAVSGGGEKRSFK